LVAKSFPGSCRRVKGRRAKALGKYGDGPAPPRSNDLVPYKDALAPDGLVLDEQTPIQQELAHDMHLATLQVPCPWREM